MFQNLIEEISAVSVVIDGVAYAPVSVVVENTAAYMFPLIFIVGGLFSIGYNVVDLLIEIVKLIISGLRSKAAE